MNVIFVSKVLDQNNIPITQIISSVPSIIIAAIANSTILSKSNTTNGLYVIDSTETKNIVTSEIEKYLQVNANTKDYKKGTYNSGTIWFEWDDNLQ